MVAILFVLIYKISAGRNTLYTHDIELTFKRYAISSILRILLRWLFYFVFGGIILLGTEDKENWSRKYSSVEKILQANKRAASDYELKATQVTNKEKGQTEILGLCI